MAETRPVAAMDPPHITEFASDRYFEKLQQLNAHQQQQQQSPSAEPVHDALNAAVSSSSTFILPVRESKAPEADAVKPADQKRDKSRFFNLRHKVPLLHSSKPSHVESDAVIPQTRSSTESTRKRSVVSSRHLSTSAHLTWHSKPFDLLFQLLPNELQIQVLATLPLTDVLHLRLASKSWHTLITLHETPIVRHHIDHHIPAYALRLYPFKTNADLTFHYLCSLWHRLHVAAKLAHLMCDWITKDIFLRQTDAQRLAFASQHEHMRRRLIPLLFTVFHFFETYRKLHLQRMADDPGYGLHQEPYTVNPIEAEIMNMYDDRTLLRVHEIFPLVISSFCRRLRPPTYVGRVERSLRGYIREKPSDDVHVAILCIGGLRQVERLWEIKGYNSRRSAVDSWYNSLTKDPPADTPAKSRRSLMSFGRKKSTGGEREPHRSSISESLHRTRSPTGSIDATNMGYDPSQWVFNTSLAAGSPMSPLSRDNAQDILSDLPVLQEIWMKTAEAMIMERKIVERTQDIKRNQQVMLDLIREGGVDEEDEWWYGRSNADSVRPTVVVHDDDAD